MLLTTNNKRAAVLPAAGIGDALLMLIASHHLQQSGWKVTTFHKALPELSSWFPTHHFALLPSLEHLDTFDKIIVENDNSPNISLLRKRFREKLSIFYPTYSPQKHGPLSPLDCAFSSTLSMAENIARASSASKDNGITPPKTLQHRLHPKRILLHPSSSQLQKNWLPERFIQLALKLKNLGYEPIFTISPAERSEWLFLEERGFSLPHLPTLSALASLIYESGSIIGNDSLIGHLASNLAIPALIIANDPKRMRLWRPDWLTAQLVFPPTLLPNFKGLRLRDTKWQHWISVRAVLQAFHKQRDTNGPVV
jgi:heptosyltransferase III